MGLSTYIKDNKQMTANLGDATAAYRPLPLTEADQLNFVRGNSPSEMRSKLASVLGMDEGKADLFARKFVHGYNVGRAYRGSHGVVLETLLKNSNVSQQERAQNEELFQLIHQYVDARKAGFGKVFQNRADYDELNPKNYNTNPQSNSPRKIISIERPPQYRHSNAKSDSKPAGGKGVISYLAGGRLKRMAAGVAAAVMLTSTMSAYAGPKEEYDRINSLLEKAEVVTFQKSDANFKYWGRKPDGELSFSPRKTVTFYKDKPSQKNRWWRNFWNIGTKIHIQGDGNGWYKTDPLADVGMEKPLPVELLYLGAKDGFRGMQPGDKAKLSNKKGDNIGVLEFKDTQQYVIWHQNLKPNPPKPSKGKQNNPIKSDDASYRVVTVNDSGSAPIVKIRNFNDPLDLAYLAYFMSVNMPQETNAQSTAPSNGNAAAGYNGAMDFGSYSAIGPDEHILAASLHLQDSPLRDKIGPAPANRPNLERRIIFSAPTQNIQNISSDFNAATGLILPQS